MANRQSLTIKNFGQYQFDTTVFESTWNTSAMWTVHHLRGVVAERAEGILPHPHYSNNYGADPAWQKLVGKYSDLSRIELVAMLSDFDSPAI